MTTKKEGAALLAAVPMLEGFSQRDLARMWESMKIVQHPDGHEIVGEGRTAIAFHLILDGTVKVERKSKRLKLGPGEFFGEMALIDAGPRTATVTADGPVTTAAMSRSTFKAIVMSRPELVWKLLVHTTQRLREEQSVTASLTS